MQSLSSCFFGELCLSLNSIALQIAKTARKLISNMFKLDVALLCFIFIKSNLVELKLMVLKQT